MQFFLSASNLKETCSTMICDSAVVNLKRHISTIKDMILSDPFLTGLSNRIDTYRVQALYNYHLIFV